MTHLHGNDLTTGRGRFALLIVAALTVLTMTLTLGGTAAPASAQAPSAKIVNGATARLFDDGNTFSYPVRVYVGPGYSSVTANLRGWDLEYASSDHHIRRGAVILTTPSYDGQYVNFRVQGAWRDQNGDDDFYWRVYYSVLAV